MNIQQKSKAGGLGSGEAAAGAAQSYHQALNQGKAIENNIIKSQNALNYLLGDAPGTKYATSDFSDINTTYANISSLPATIIGNRPDVAVSALQYKVYAQDVTATYTQLLPQFMLAAGPGGVLSGGIAGNQPTELIQMNFINWTLNPTIFSQASSYKGQKHVAYVTFIDTVNKALRDVNNDLATNQITNERYKLLKLVEQDAQTKYSDQYRDYKGGIKSYAETLSGKENLTQVKITVSQMRLAQMQAIITLYQDLGGGYRYGE